MKLTIRTASLSWVTTAMICVLVGPVAQAQHDEVVPVPIEELVPAEPIPEAPPAVESWSDHAAGEESEEISQDTSDKRPLDTSSWDDSPVWMDDLCFDDCLPHKGLLHDPWATGCCPPYRWMVRADAIFLDRSSADGEQSLVFSDPIDPKGTEIFNTGEFNFSTRWGPRISLIHCLNDRHSFEVGYFSIDDWDSVATRSGNIAVQFPSFAHPSLPPGPFGTVNFAYSSQLRSFEANVRRVSHACWLTWIAGFRYLELDEDFGAVFNTGGGTSHYSINTSNHLSGFQLGAETYLWQRGALRLDGWFKMALLFNSASQFTFEDVAAIGGGAATASARRDLTGFLGELGVSATYQLSCRLALRAGYQALWLDRVALAPEQLDNTNPSIPMATVDLNGDLFLHGGFVGLEALF